MKRYVGQFISLAVLLATCGAAALAESVSASEQKLTGTVTCAARITGQYACRKGQTLQSCTLDCVQQGFKYELMVSPNLAYQLEGSSAQLERFAGGKAIVTGIVAPGENRVQVQSIANVAKRSRSNRE
jgi:TATA-box binding protein (TBP) (component of TFIID and TFIIIB)